MRLLVTRPEPDATALADMLGARGHRAVIEPLLRIRRLDNVELPIEDATALVVTSAHAIAMLDVTQHLLGLPIYCVGERTAAAARHAGFREVRVATGDVDRLAALIIQERRPDEGDLVYLAGTVRAGDLAGQLRRSGFTVRLAETYESVPIERLSENTEMLLADGSIDGVLLFSPRTAQTLSALLDQAGLGNPAGRLDAWCLSPSIADMIAMSGFRHIHIAAHPTQAALLDLLPAGNRLAQAPVPGEPARDRRIA
jgi:uroporphyrinogen-III synthase